MQKIVAPPAVYKGDYNQQKGWWECSQQIDGVPNGWGCGYVYGFRVPLLVVSEYTPPHTISGAISGPLPPTYPPPKEWTHDFGSILAFTENNFTVNEGLYLPPIAPSPYTYADQNSLDAIKLPNGQTAVPLWDFFLGPQRDFTQINPINPQDTASYFNNYYYQYNEAPIGPETGDPDD